MTEPANPRQPRASVTRAEIDAIKARLQHLAELMDHSQKQLADMQGGLEEAAARALASEIAAQQTHDMVHQLHDALMQPSPGQTRGLLDRMALVAISIESGERIGRVVLWGAGVLAALGAAFASIRFGSPN